MNIAALIIHLERATNRRRNVDELITACPVPASVQNAIDGQHLDNEHFLNFYAINIHKPQYPFVLRGEEVAAFASHRSCWQRVVNEHLDAAIIMEDDVCIESEQFRSSVMFAGKNISGCGHIQFSPKPLRRIGTRRRVLAEGNMSIVRSCVVPLGAQAYFLSGARASQLLKATHRIDRPVDTFLQLYWLTHVPIYTLYPSGIVTVDSRLGGSTIHVRGKREQWLVREWKRLRYRSAIRYLSRKNWKMAL